MRGAGSGNRSSSFCIFTHGSRCCERRASAVLLPVVEALLVEFEGAGTRRVERADRFDQATVAGVSVIGHDEPTILLTNERRPTAAKLITRYAQRMLIENALSDAVRFFHMNALS